MSCPVANFYLFYRCCVPEASKVTCLTLPLDQAILQAAKKNLKIDAFGLARALSSSPLWLDLDSALMVLRPEPEPIFALIGNFNDADRARIRTLSKHLTTIIPRSRLIDYQQAQQDCEILAAKLVHQFGRDEIEKFHFSAIPRGGYIVLGMLAYILNLQHHQLEPFCAEGIPLVIVDDCSISGARFRTYLNKYPDRKIIFSHLYSHPDLRAAILQQEENVIACISSHDLSDFAPENLGEDYQAWQQRWLERSPDSAYWIGQPEHICFSWNEPDTSYWNPVTQQEEKGWHLVPPELCLKNRISQKDLSRRLQIQSPGKGALQPPANVIFADLQERGIVIINSSTETSLHLESVAADMWRFLINYQTVDEAIAEIENQYLIDKTIVTRDLQQFIQTLLEHNLLEKTNDSASGSTTDFA